MIKMYNPIKYPKYKFHRHKKRIATGDNNRVKCGTCGWEVQIKKPKIKRLNVEYEKFEGIIPLTGPYDEEDEAYINYLTYGNKFPIPSKYKDLDYNFGYNKNLLRV